VTFSPLYAQLTGVPPALFSCGPLDRLLDDTLFMAARWQAAANASELALYPGAPHEFLNLRDRIGAEGDGRDRMLASSTACWRVDAQLTAISIGQVQHVAVGEVVLIEACPRRPRAAPCSGACTA
jgi:acetyl esterase/lipase